MPSRLELVGRRLDGREFPVEVTLSPLEGGDDTLLFAQIVDIRRRRGPEARLRGDEPALLLPDADAGWIDRIEDALANRRLRLLAQPIRDLDSGEVRQHELLLRMLDPAGDAVPPGAFLAIAERYDLIQELDRWVVAEAIGLVEQRQAEGETSRVEVNVSGRSLGDPELLELIERELLRTRVDPAMLIFEVTETAAVANMGLARTFAERLRKLGCRFALDDFGAGFGSFYYLKHIPFDYLKIDGEFVTGCLDDATDRLVIESLVAIARGLGKRTIAEGVEDPDTERFLRARGVDFAQGFHVGRPAPLHEALI